MTAFIVEKVLVKTCDLKGSALRHALAQAHGQPFEVYPPTYGSGYRMAIRGHREFFRPESCWEQAGPIIDVHWQAITDWLTDSLGSDWRDHINGVPGDVLVWMMRGYVGSILGNTIEVPLDIVAHPSS